MVLGYPVEPEDISSLGPAVLAELVLAFGFLRSRTDKMPLHKVMHLGDDERVFGVMKALVQMFVNEDTLEGYRHPTTRVTWFMKAYVIAAFPGSYWKHDTEIGETFGTDLLKQETLVLQENLYGSACRVIAEFEKVLVVLGGGDAFDTSVLKKSPFMMYLHRYQSAYIAWKTADRARRLKYTLLYIEEIFKREKQLKCDQPGFARSLEAGRREEGSARRQAIRLSAEDEFDTMEMIDAMRERVFQ